MGRITEAVFQKETMGFYVTGHPLMNYEGIIKRYTNTDSKAIGELPASSQVKLAGLVKRIKEINTRKGERMAFISLEDLAGDVEVTVFADLYQQSRDLLHSAEPLIVSGVREGDADTPKVLAQEICPIHEAPQRFSRGIRIKISTRGAHPHQVKDLRQILARHRGRLPVRLHVVIPNRSETVISLSSVSCDASDAMMNELHRTFGYQPVSFE